MCRVAGNGWLQTSVGREVFRGHHVPTERNCISIAVLQCGRSSSLGKVDRMLLYFMSCFSIDVFMLYIQLLFFVEVQVLQYNMMVALRIVST